jgi:hypothetical protein
VRAKSYGSNNEISYIYNVLMKENDDDLNMDLMKVLSYANSPIKEPLDTLKMVEINE